MPANIDLRAEVLKGIDQQLEDFNGLFARPEEAKRLAEIQGALLTALRHLREIAGMHLIVDDNDDEGPYCGFCNTYLLGRPGCSVLLSLAPDYAPQALAQMEADRDR